MCTNISSPYLIMFVLILLVLFYYICTYIICPFLIMCVLILLVSLLYVY